MQPESEQDRVTTVNFGLQVAAIVTGLDKKTFAEFVEPPEALQSVKALGGLKYAQGYLIGRPSPYIEAPPHTVTA